MAHRIQLIALVALASACGINVIGVAPEPGPDASAPDGAATLSDAATGGGDRDAIVAPPPPADCSKTDCKQFGLAATGFTPILFGDAADVCPAGFDSADGFEDPKPKNDSCACDTCTSTGASCAAGTLVSRYSSDTKCDKGGAAPFVTSGVCKSFASTSWADTYASEIPYPAVAGTCKAPGKAVRENVDLGTKRVCTPRPDTCQAALCSATGKLQPCLVADGEKACPLVALDRHVVGREVKLTCNDCLCTATATCGGKLSWWESDPKCEGTATGTFDGNTCTRVDARDIGSFRWDAVVASQGCDGVKPVISKALAALDGPRTICCPK